METKTKGWTVHENWENAVRDITSSFGKAGFEVENSCVCTPPNSEELVEAGKDFYNRRIKKDITIELVLCRHFKKPTILPFRSEGFVAVIEGFAVVDPIYFYKRPLMHDSRRERKREMGTLSERLTTEQGYQDFRAKYGDRLSPSIKTGTVSFYAYGGKFGDPKQETGTNFACNFVLAKNSKCRDSYPEGSCLYSLARDHEKTDYWESALGLPSVVRKVSNEEMAKILKT